MIFFLTLAAVLLVSTAICAWQTWYLMHHTPAERRIDSLRPLSQSRRKR